MTAVWQPGKTYVPGSLVRPVKAPQVSGGQPTNPSFEDGTTGWAFGTGFSVTQNAHYDGDSAAEYNGNGIAVVLSTDQRPVTPGQVITASCMVQQGKSSSGKASGEVLLQWYDESHVFIAQSEGHSVVSGSGGHWQRSSVTATAPDGAAFVAIGGASNKDSAYPLWLDAFEWSYTYFIPAGGLVYKAVQAAPGKSAATEPDWPPVLGQQVIDNEVIWEAVSASQIVWTARPINKSGPTEPLWPLIVDGFIHDGTIDWKTTSPRITDANCPNSKIVAIAASKVYAADNDIIRYCSTVNPLDWTTKDDAGYLPYGLQTYGSNPVAALGLYRSNLVAFNAEGFQMWQVDEDPSASALLDALPVGSTHHEALSPVSNDLFFLSSQGVRTIGIAASSTNLEAGDVGMPIDDLIKEAIATTQIEPIGIYVPAMGQYWLAISGLANADPSLSGHIDNNVVGTVVDMHYVVTGGTTPVVLDIMSGALPTGLAMDSSGHVTGTMAVGGEAPEWVVRATDASGRTVILYDSCEVYAGLEPQQIWRYLQVASSDSTDYSSSGFDDSGWATGQAPFGSWEDGSSDGLPAAHEYDDRLVAKFASNWTTNTGLWMRKTLDLDDVPEGGFTVVGYIEDHCHFYVNGSLIFTTPEDQEEGGGFVQTIPADALVVGSNVIAVRCDDEPPVPTPSVVYADFLLQEAS